MTGSKAAGAWLQILKCPLSDSRVTFKKTAKSITDTPGGLILRMTFMEVFINL